MRRNIRNFFQATDRPTDDRKTVRPHVRPSDRPNERRPTPRAVNVQYLCKFLLGYQILIRNARVIRSSLASARLPEQPIWKANLKKLLALTEEHATQLFRHNFSPGLMLCTSADFSVLEEKTICRAGVHLATQPLSQPPRRPLFLACGPGT